MEHEERILSEKKWMDIEPGQQAMVAARFGALIAQRAENAYSWAKFSATVLLSTSWGGLISCLAITTWGPRDHNDIGLFVPSVLFVFGLVLSVLLVATATQKAREDLVRDTNYFKRMLDGIENVRVDGSGEFTVEKAYGTRILRSIVIAVMIFCFDSAGLVILAIDVMW